MRVVLPPRIGANRSGFTLIELMIVIVIIGILAAIAIPNYFSMTENARRASCISNQRNIVPHASLYASDNGIFSGTVTVGDLYTAGVVPADLAECPLSTTVDHDDYEITLVGGVITNVDCLVVGSDHEWTP